MMPILPIRSFYRALLAVVLALLGPAAALAAPASSAAPVDFNREVRPILSGMCFKCHGIDDKARKGGLRLDVREAAIRPAKSEKIAIVPGKPEASELVRRILTEDEDDLMPPPATKRVLSAAQKQVLKRWVAEGAEYQPHWAFVAPMQAPLPAVKQGGWAKNAIDAYVLAKLEAEGLAPSPEADRYTLVRRVYLDLIGLPPTPEEADAFVKDASPQAYEALVDRLLAAPQYGERWARRWLDLARYSDTNGYEKDRPRSMWAYRDWVINALNADMPFDQFTIEQIAGDMLPGATLAQKTATGFHRNTMINEEGGIDPLEYRFYSMVDRVGTTGTTWLGLTVMCAQCHTHKFDPILQKEYYGLMAFLNNANEPVMELTTAEIAAKRAEAETKAEKMWAELPEKFAVGKTGGWTPVAGTLTTAGVSKAEKLADNSWRIGGDAPEKDAYTFTFDSDGAPVDRIRLETLAEDGHGPGRTPHGNFVLSEFSVSAGPKAEPATAKKVKVARAEADFAQVKYPVEHAIDGSKQGGWGISPQENKDHAATFYLAAPVANAGGTHWAIKLDQQFGTKHTIGRLRISIGTKTQEVLSDPAMRKVAVEKAFSEWQAQQAGAAVRWSAIRPSRMSSNAPTLTQLEDGSILVSGDITKSDHLDLNFNNEINGITAVRLEALPDSSLPGNGPGKVYYEGPAGDFFLSEMNLSADGKPAAFASAVESFASGKNNAAKAIDGDQQSGWSINGGQGKAHHAVFVLAKPLGDVKELALRMLFEKYYAATIGRFRIWVSTDPKAGKTTPLPPEVENALATAAEQRTAEQSAAIFRHWLSVAPELAEGRKQIDAVRAGVPKPQTTLVMSERPAGHTRVTHLHNRGEFLQPKEEIEPCVPGFLPAIASDAPRTRLTFARWLVSPENPLTARVMVNRQWAAIFGRGIVRTTEDFGFQGELPSNQPLLDYLAVEFVKEGWSMKKLHRLIVTSATYRQSSKVTPELLAKDPLNVLLARGPRFREEAEIVRDSALKAAGLLSTKIGGPSVFPPQPPSVTTEGAYGPLQWKASTGEDRYRRSLYTFNKRTAPFALYSTFDAPSGDVCVARREISNTPLQALSLLNDEVFVEAAQAMGKTFAALKETDQEKAAAIFRRFMTRPADADELAMLVEFTKAQRARLSARPADAKKLAGAGNAEADAVEIATWTATARAVMTLDEGVTKN